MPKHTEGPWQVSAHGHSVSTANAVSKGADGLMYSESIVENVRPPLSEEGKANARLIAAAPDLLAALERLLNERCPFAADADSCECGENGDGTDEDGKPCEHRQAYAAIAKATAGR